jgi:phosphoserine phosphatase
MNKLLVVDLCGTIVRKNTTHDFMANSALPLLRRMAARLILSRVAGFLYTRIRPELQRKNLIACLRGVKRSNLLQLGRDYANTTLTRYPRVEVVQRIRSAQKEGVPVVLASASLDFIVAGFAHVLEVSAAASTQLRYSESGYCLGVIGVDATGNKLSILREFMGPNDLEFDVITDNPEDTDLMSVASNSWFIDADS